MLLSELKVHVDAGCTAKLRQWRSILHWFVRKERGWYVKHAEGYTNDDGVVVVQAQTAFYLAWEGLVSSLGYDAASSGWQLTYEELEDYFPPERLPEDEAESGHNKAE